MKLGCRLFIATGLHQNPHHKNTFYWRIKDHAEFLKLIGIPQFENVVPRMSRDFLINCADKSQALDVEHKLTALHLEGDKEKIFTVDNRGESLFVELTYSKELKSGSIIFENGKSLDIDLLKYVSFIAIKNGEHDGVGYFVDTGKTRSLQRPIHVKEIFTQTSLKR